LGGRGKKNGTEEGCMGTDPFKGKNLGRNWGEGTVTGRKKKDRSGGTKTPVRHGKRVGGKRFHRSLFSLRKRSVTGVQGGKGGGGEFYSTKGIALNNHR